VYEALLERRKIAYTTVMTMLNILEDKGHLKKAQGEKAYVYRPANLSSRLSGAWCASFWIVCSTGRRSAGGAPDRRPETDSRGMDELFRMVRRTDVEKAK